MSADAEVSTSDTIASRAPLRARIKGRCLWMLVALVGFVLLYHYALRNPAFTVLANSLVLIAGIYAVSSSRLRLAVGLVIAVAQAAIALAALHVRSLELAQAGEALLALFFGYTLLCVLAYVMRGRHVTIDKLYGAASVYLLIGFTCSAIYALIYATDPRSFAFEATHQRALPDFVYFSFVTLLSLGYGDVTPVSGAARSVAIFEGVSGVLYLTLLVARLVGLYGNATDGECQ